MILYLDTSALVKLYVDEPFSEQVGDLVSQAEAVITSRVAYAEACAALALGKRLKRIGHKPYAAALEALQQQWPGIRSVEIDEMAAGALAIKHNLRGFDAIHVAAALEVRAAAPAAALVFGTFDRRQWTAARNEELSVMPENRP